MSERNSKINQFSKSTSSKPYREFPVTTSTFSRLAILLSVLSGFFSVSNSYASSISISLTGNVSLNLLKDNTQPVFGKSTEATATVTSDHFTGYTFTITGSNDTGKLENNDKSKFLSSIDTAISENTFRTNSDYNDHWGFFPDTLYENNTTIQNSLYRPSPTTTGTTIDITNSSTDEDGNEYKLALGAKVSPSMALDSYGQTFVLAATGNGYDYHIGYSDVMDTLPADQYGNTQDASVNLSATEPTKSGYTFAGWCTEVPTVSINGTTCPAGADVYQAGDPVDLNGNTANNMELYAIWSAVTFTEAYGSTAMTMQNMTGDICSQVAVGQEATLTDTRSGNKTYKVGKMKDGKCWMLDNLALGGNSTITLTSADTNIEANWTLPASASYANNSYTEARINARDVNIVPSDDMSTAGGWKVGVYYNYCAATAGTYCSASGVASGPIIQDVCPKGWRMPSGGPGGEYQAIYDAYEKDYANFRTDLHLPFSGHFNGPNIFDQGLGGWWWSSTFYDGNYVYRPAATVSTFGAAGAYSRAFGFSVRCIAK